MKADRDKVRSKLLVGFDAAWTAKRRGALVGILVRNNGGYEELGPPRIANYQEACELITQWQCDHSPSLTLVLLDQPTIVKNSKGQRPVEKIVGAAISRRYGGMQPASVSKAEMFGPAAPVWAFLDRFRGPANLLGGAFLSGVVETYPALVLIALNWTLPDSRPSGRLPKYNPKTKTFLRSDWEYVCRSVRAAMSDHGLKEVAKWADQAQRGKPCKESQDCLDACLCLLVALYLAEGKECLMVGDQESGYIVVPHADQLRIELERRCNKIAWTPGEWVRRIRLVGGFPPERLAGKG